MVVCCLERDADLHMVQLMPLPLTVSCFSKIPSGITFLVPADPGSSGQRAVKWVCVCVCVCYTCKRAHPQHQQQQQQQRWQRRRRAGGDCVDTARHERSVCLESDDLPETLTRTIVLPRHLKRRTITPLAAWRSG